MLNIFEENGEEIGIPILEFDVIRRLANKTPNSRSQTLFFDYFFRENKEKSFTYDNTTKNIFFPYQKCQKEAGATSCRLTAWGCRECDCLRVKISKSSPYDKSQTLSLRKLHECRKISKFWKMKL